MWTHWIHLLFSVAVIVITSVIVLTLCVCLSVCKLLGPPAGYFLVQDRKEIILFLQWHMVEYDSKNQWTRDLPGID